MAAISAITNINDVQNSEEVFKTTDITSAEMLTAINRWLDLYYESDVSDCDSDDAQRIPYIIVDGLDKAVFSEYKCNNPSENPLHIETMKQLDKIRKRAFQKACIGGEILIKPIMRNGGFCFTVIPRQNITVLGRDETDAMTDIVTQKRTTVNEGRTKAIYTLHERRTVDSNGYLTIENKLFKSSNTQTTGREVKLKSLPEYEKLRPKFTYPTPFYSLGLIQLKTPMENCVDGSHDGVSIYAPAVKEIEKLYRHESRMQDEYDMTTPRLVASIDLQEKNIDGRTIDIPKFITPAIDSDPDETGLTAWNPKPNQIEIEARDDQIKRAIENIIGLRRGFLSKSDVQEFTATEILSTTTKMAHLIGELQDMWSDAVPEIIRVCTLLAGEYDMTNWGEAFEVVIEWGNGVLYDEDKEFNRLNLLTTTGKLKDEYLLGWFFDLPTENPEDLIAIRKKYMPGTEEVVEEDVDA